MAVAIEMPGIENACADTNDKLDVNLNTIYLGTRSQPDAAVLSEDIVQIPLPLTEHAKNTGQGPFGGLTYFDLKTLALVQSQLGYVRGLGRIYYSYSVPGDTPHTFVPYVTLYRDILVNYKDVGATIEGASAAWLPPGFMYAYRTNEHMALHLDMELYSRSQTGNNRSRFGVSYMPSWPWIVSASYERTAWDMSETINGKPALLKGYSGGVYLKVILRDPPQGNFAFILGTGTTRNAVGPMQTGPIESQGAFFGIEASGGVLAW